MSRLKEARRRQKLSREIEAVGKKSETAVESFRPALDQLGETFKSQFSESQKGLFEGLSGLQEELVEAINQPFQVDFPRDPNIPELLDAVSEIDKKLSEQVIPDYSDPLGELKKAISEIDIPEAKGVDLSSVTNALTSLEEAVNNRKLPTSYDVEYGSEGEVVSVVPVFG